MSGENTETSLEGGNDIGDQFMLAQFAEMNQDFRHYDQRVETALNIYAAAWALLLAGVITLYSATRDIGFLFQVAGAPAIILCALGLFTVRWVINLTISRDRRRAAANLAQLYFTLRAPKISPHLIKLGRTPQPLKNTLQESKFSKRDYDVSFPDSMVHFIVVLNALLAGLAVASVSSWLFQAQRLWLLYILVAGVTLAERLFAYQKRKKQYLQKKR